MDEEQKKLVQEVFERHPEIMVAYLFGSRARGTAGPMSDYDFAVQLSGQIDNFVFSTQLSRELSSIFKTDKVDIVVLNGAKDPVLRREAVLLGECLYAKEGFPQFELERKILHEYEDTKHFRREQFRFLRERILNGTFGKPVI